MMMKQRLLRGLVALVLVAVAATTTTVQAAPVTGGPATSSRTTAQRSPVVKHREVANVVEKDPSRIDVKILPAAAAAVVAVPWKRATPKAVAANAGTAAAKTVKPHVAAAAVTPKAAAAVTTAAAKPPVASRTKNAAKQHNKVAPAPVSAQPAPAPAPAPASATAPATAHAMEGVLPADAPRPAASVRAGEVSAAEPDFESAPEPIPREGQGFFLRNQINGLAKTFQLGANTIMQGAASGGPVGFFNGLNAANKQVTQDLNGVMADTADTLTAYNDYVAAGGNPRDFIDLTMSA